MTRKIAIVEDDKNTIKLYQLLFKSLDAELLVAEDGDTGLALVEQQNPDLLILDIQLPGKTGIEVARALRSNDQFAHLPILVVSSALDSENQQIFRELGVQETMPKPIDTRKLTELVKDLLA